MEIYKAINVMLVSLNIVYHLDGAIVMGKLISSMNNILLVFLPTNLKMKNCIY